MVTYEQVKLITDTNYIPVKYVVMEVTLGSTLANSYVWLKQASYGVATEADLNSYYDSPKRSLLVGTMSVYSITTLDKVVAYSRNVSVKEVNVPIG